MNNSDKTSPSKPLRASAIPHWDIETDIAIVGFGGAGACAAIEAADAGATVQLFELASASGGSTNGGGVGNGSSGASRKRQRGDNCDEVGCINYSVGRPHLRRASGWAN